MKKPAQMEGCPPGLEYLTQVESLGIFQEIHLLNGRITFRIAY